MPRHRKRVLTPSDDSAAAAAAPGSISRGLGQMPDANTSLLRVHDVSYYAESVGLLSTKSRIDPAYHRFFLALNQSSRVVDINSGVDDNTFRAILTYQVKGFKTICELTSGGHSVSGATATKLVRDLLKALPCSDSADKENALPDPIESKSIPPSTRKAKDKEGQNSVFSAMLKLANLEEREKVFAKFPELAPIFNHTCERFEEIFNSNEENSPSENRQKSPPKRVPVSPDAKTTDERPLELFLEMFKHDIKEAHIKSKTKCPSVADQDKGGERSSLMHSSSGPRSVAMVGIDVDLRSGDGQGYAQSKKQMVEFGSANYPIPQPWRSPKNDLQPTSFSCNVRNFSKDPNNGSNELPVVFENSSMFKSGHASGTCVIRNVEGDPTSASFSKDCDDEETNALDHLALAELRSLTPDTRALTQALEVPSEDTDFDHSCETVFSDISDEGAVSYGTHQNETAGSWYPLLRSESDETSGLQTQ